jgi:hypothetical protein
VALAAAELVHSSVNAAPPEPAAAAVRPPAVAAVAVSRSELGSSPPSTAPRPELLVGGVAQWLGEPAVLLLGARVTFRFPLGPILVPTLSADGSRGEVAVPSAQVTAETITAGLHLYAGRADGPFRFEAGAGARGGWVRLSARPTADATALEGHELGAPWGGPELRARAAYHGRHPHSPIAAIELGAGFVVLPVHGLRDGAARVFAVEGPWISVGGELGFTL